MYVLQSSVTATEAFVLYALGPNIKGFRCVYTHSLLAGRLSSAMIQDLHRTSTVQSVFDLVSCEVCKDARAGTPACVSIAHLSKQLVVFFRPSDAALFCGAEGDVSATAVGSAPLKPSASSVQLNVSNSSTAGGDDRLSGPQSLKTPAFLNQARAGAVLNRVRFLFA
jgi:hypothetical protein